MTSRWLRLVRIHTASLTQPAVLLGFILSGSTAWWKIPLFALFAIIYHAAGFIYNDIRDAEQDRSDPAKQHFPLISGEISIRQARILTLLLMSMVLAGGIILSNGRIFSIFSLLGAVFFGVLYNIRSKKDLFSPVYIAAAFICLPLFSFTAHKGSIDNLTVAVISYLFFLMLFQIGVEGYMKDISADRVSLLHRLGTVLKEDGVLHVGRPTQIFGWGLKIPVMVLFVLIGMLAESSYPALMTGGIFLLGNGWATVKLLSPGHYSHRRRVRYCALIEIFTYSQLIFALQGILGWPATLICVGYPYLWYIVLNRLTWETWVTPRV